MSKTLNPEWLHWPQTQRLIAAFAAPDAPLRFVGGAVRDTLLEKAVGDVDAATPLLPEATMALLQAAHIKAIPTGLAHGTITAVIDGKHFEITTLRRDVATDGRHAVVEYTDDWQADAARRDFTMNALYLSPAGELFDYFAGETDLEDGHVRFIGDAIQRIAEDYLRILRFFRFHAHYGNGAPDATALAACADAAPHISSLSGERVQYELLKLLAAPSCSATLQLMHEHRIIENTLGFAISGIAMFTRLEQIERIAGLSLEPAVRLTGFVLAAPLSEDAPLTRMVERLRLSNATVKMLEIIFACQEGLSARMHEAAQKKWLRKLGAAAFINALIVRWAYGDEPIQPQHPYAAMLQLAARWQPPLFPISGDDLIVRGIKPGKPLGDLLRQLEEKWEASDYKMTKEQLLEILT